MAPQADPPRAKCSSIDPLSFIFLQKLDFHDQRHDFYLVFFISTPVFHEDALFHLEPFEVCLQGIMFEWAQWAQAPGAK